MTVGSGGTNSFSSYCESMRAKLSPERFLVLDVYREWVKVAHRDDDGRDDLENRFLVKVHALKYTNQPVITNVGCNHAALVVKITSLLPIMLIQTLTHLRNNRVD